MIAHGYDYCIFETDPKSVVNACNCTPGQALFGTIVDNCLLLLKHVNHVLISFAYRSVNRVAYMLAQAAHSTT